MKKTICTLTIAAASCMIFGDVAQAQSRMDGRILEQRTMTEAVQGPELRVQPRAKVYSGETLAGRRELISEDGVIVRGGEEPRAIFREGDDIESAKVRGFLGSEPNRSADEVEIELEIDD